MTAWALDLYTSGNEKWANYAESTRSARSAIFSRYRKAQGARPVKLIKSEDIELALYAKGGHAAVNEAKAIQPVFEHLRRLGFIRKNPMAGIELDKPKIKGFLVADAEDISAFQEHWPVGTRERLIFDLGLYTGAARADLANLGRKNIEGGLLKYKRQKSGVVARVPITAELRAVIERTPDIAPAFILTKKGKPFKAASLGNGFGCAAREAGMASRLLGFTACAKRFAFTGRRTMPPRTKSRLWPVI